MRTPRANERLHSAAMLAALLCAAHLLTQQAAAASPTTIWSFTGTGGDGEYPLAPLVFDASGNLYGTTSIGGASSSGTVFKLVPPVGSGNWTESVLYSFGGGSDGSQPNNGAVFGANGALYGTSYNGGTQNYGTVFEVAPPSSGNGPWTHSVLYLFQGGYDGQNPGAAVFGPDGALYGTAGGGPPSGRCTRVGCGIVFRLAPPASLGSRQ